MKQMDTHQRFSRQNFMISVFVLIFFVSLISCGGGGGSGGDSSDAGTGTSTDSASDTGSDTTTASGSEMKRYIDQNIDLLLQVSNTTCAQDSSNISEIADSLNSVFANLFDSFNALFQGLPTSCPEVTITPTPSVLNMAGPYTIDIDYGTGCETEDGSITSGSTEFTLSNIAFNLITNSLSAKYTADFSDIAVNNETLVDGSLNGDMSGTAATETRPGNFTFNINFIDTLILNNPVSGAIRMTGENTGGQVSSTPSSVTLTFSNFTSGNQTFKGGSITLTQIDEATTKMVMTNLMTGTETLNGTLVLKTSEADQTLTIDSESAGTIGVYTFEVRGLTMDATACTCYPVSGDIVFSRNGNSGTVSFTASCDGQYQYSEAG